MGKIIHEMVVALERGYNGIFAIPWCMEWAWDMHGLLVYVRCLSFSRQSHI